MLLGGGGVVVFSGGCWLCGGPVAVGNGSVRGLCGSGSLSEDMLEDVSEELDELLSAIGSAAGCSSLLTGG